MSKQEFTLTVEVEGNSEDERLELARQAFRKMTEDINIFSFHVDFDDIEEED